MDRLCLNGDPKDFPASKRLKNREIEGRVDQTRSLRRRKGWDANIFDSELNFITAVVLIVTDLNKQYSHHLGILALQISRTYPRPTENHELSRGIQNSRV